jgi:PHD/YefM family antitoxin component YafN of YafNO toxin-antitoxin module
MKPNTIPAKEIKRRGIGAVDELLERGPVHVIQRDEPVYVVMTEARYRELVEAEEEAASARIKEALEDVAAGRTRKVTAEELIKEFDLE